MARLLADSEGADDFGFVGLHIVLRDAEAVLLVEGDDKFDEFSDINAGLHLTVEDGAGGLGELGIVDGVDGLMQRFDVEEAVLLADRIIVLSPRPAKVVESLSVEIAKPRRRSDPQVVAMRQSILELLGAGQ